MRAGIELDDDYGWGPNRMLVVELEKDGYSVQEIIGTHRMLTLWGSEPDPSAVLDAYRQ